MSVVIETTLGDITIDLFLKERPRACLNFLKLCKIKYYNYSLFHTVSRNFIAQTGDPTGSRNGGESVFGVLEGPLKRYFEAERNPRIKHTNMGLVSFVGNEENMIGSQFFITLGTDLTYLDETHCVFAEVVEGLDVLEILNEAICDGDNRPYQDIRITHTVILDDPFPDPKKLRIPERSPSPSAERLQGGRIAPDEDIDETVGKSAQEIQEMIAEREEKARATILEMVGDIPDADMAPPENVLFVCKLNPVTTDDDLEIIFSRFGKIKSCEIIRDKKTGDSLQYAFVEFEEEKSCEDAYFKMDNVLIDDRRIHVDFSQSVAKVKWHGKGRGVTTYDDKGKKISDTKNDIGNGRYKPSKQQNDRKTYKKDFENGKSNSEKSRNYSKNDEDRNRSYRDEKRSSRDQEDNYSRNRNREDNFSRDRNREDNFWRDRNKDNFTRNRNREENTSGNRKREDSRERNRENYRRDKNEPNYSRNRDNNYRKEENVRRYEETSRKFYGNREDNYGKYENRDRKYDDSDRKYNDRERKYERNEYKRNNNYEKDGRRMDRYDDNNKYDEIKKSARDSDKYSSKRKMEDDDFPKSSKYDKEMEMRHKDKKQDKQRKRNISESSSESEPSKKKLKKHKKSSNKKKRKDSSSSESESSSEEDRKKQKKKSKNKSKRKENASSDSESSDDKKKSNKKKKSKRRHSTSDSD